MKQASRTEHDKFKYDDSDQVKPFVESAMEIYNQMDEYQQAALVESLITQRLNVVYKGNQVKSIGLVTK